MNLTTIYKLFFYWIGSYAIASVLYYVLWSIMPNHYVFGMFYKMILYHWAFPMQYIAIPCFFYGILATIFSNKFQNKKIGGRIFLTVIIIVLSVLLSSPFGGMLWHFHDMSAGHFPTNWIIKMITEGFKDGILIGWFVVLFSIPYNIFCGIISFFLTKEGIALFGNGKE